MALLEFFQHIHNFFLKSPAENIRTGEYTISDGALELDFLVDGQYFRIVGSALNDGVYVYPATELRDETFDGAVWAMYVPPEVVTLIGEIDAWNTANAEAVASPYQSESFGGYSYSLKSGSGGTGSVTWQSQFESRLNPWRRLSVL